ncbi:hypothetical protein K438DRAFT_1842852 [Mycena galopus ATCC 62051]|nr:hypothetical protein K438DRAFT_1842852 [Mycena galopus ATCC 62051]
MSSTIPGHANTFRPPPEDAESKNSQSAAQLKSSPAGPSKIPGGASASRAPQGPASAKSSPTKCLTAIWNTISSRARQVTVGLKSSPTTNSSMAAGSMRTSTPLQRLARPNSLSLTESSVVPGNTTISRPPQETARSKSLSTKPSTIHPNENAPRPHTGTSVSAEADSGVIPHQLNQFLDSRIQAGLLASSSESRVLIMGGGQGGRGGSGGLQGQGGAGGTGEGARVHITAQNVTNIHPSPAMVQASQVLNHCPPPSKNFQGRQAILNEMHQFFAQVTGAEHIYVLYGLGGAGKTQIALKVIADSTGFTDRLLVDASSTERIETGLKNIAIAKASGESWQDGLGWLLSKHEPWLLFFDNADDPQVDLNNFVPRCNHGNIIITSRNQGLKGYGAHTLVSDMEELDAIALLLKSAHHIVSQTNNQLAAALVQELCYLPLAIVQAGAFILQSEDLSGYLALFTKNRVNLLSEKPARSYDGYSLSVFTTWQICFNKLSQLAAMLLQLCSFLHWDGISEDIFSRASEYSFPSWGPPKGGLQKALEFLSHFVGPNGEWNPFDFVKVTNEIKAYSLINFNVEQKSFSIHPLVHEWSQTTLADLHSTHLCMIDILGMSIAAIPKEDRFPVGLRLVSHVNSLMLAVSEISWFGPEYAQIYWYTGQSTKAMKLDINTLEKTREILGDDHPEVLVAMHNLAHSYWSLGQFEDAKQLQLVVLEKWRKGLKQLQVVVLEKWRQSLSDEHPDTLTAMNNLASTYHSLGQFEDAEKLQLVALEKRRKILGDEHPDTLTAMNNLGNTCRSLGRFEEAEKLQLVTYWSLGRFENAERLQLVVLEKQRKILGDNHPHTLAAISHLANTYHSLGQFEEAEQLQLMVLEKQ